VKRETEVLCCAHCGAPVRPSAERCRYCGVEHGAPREVAQDASPDTFTADDLVVRALGLLPGMADRYLDTHRVSPRRVTRGRGRPTFGVAHANLPRAWRPIPTASSTL